MIEIWQANAAGRYNHPDDKQEKPLDQSFTGWGRSGSEPAGSYFFETIKPGPVPAPDESVQAPHINVIVFARGMLVHAFTRIYFSDEPANETDPVLNSIEKEAPADFDRKSPGRKRQSRLPFRHSSSGRE